MALVLVVWSNLLIYTLEDLHTRGALFAFLLSFFVFLIGRETLERFQLHKIEIVFDEIMNLHAESLILISLVCLAGGYFLGFCGKKSGKTDDQLFMQEKINKIRRISRRLFYVTFAFNLLTLLDIVLYVARFGYFRFYTSYTTSVPYIIRKVGEMCPVSFWVFLATMPEKKDTRRVGGLYIFYLLLSLGTGKRFPFAAGVLTLFVYFVSRNMINNYDRKKWLDKKHLIPIACCVPFIVLLLFLVGKIRGGVSLSGMNPVKALTDFLYGQGVSINIIKRAEKYKNLLPTGKKFLFGSTYEAITGNIIFRMLGVPSYSGNTVEHALYGHSFQHTISYVVMGNYYLQGHGLGSCYIEEAFFDYGYAGVVMVNCLFGYAIKKLGDFSEGSVWKKAFVLIALPSFLLAPRGSADGCIKVFVDLTTWGTMFIIWIMSQLSYV